MTEEKQKTTPGCHDLHRVAGFVTGLVTEHTDNRVRTIVETLHAECILFNTVHSPLDFNEIRCL